jgi:phosphoribosylanthranilate isomerase
VIVMQETRIKISGITSVEDARLSLSAGVDYLGLDFSCGTHPVSVPTARAIRRALPTAMLVGIFCDSPIEEILVIGRTCGLNMIQLRGNESPEYCSSMLRRLSLPVVKTFGVDELADPAILNAYTRTSYFVLDLDGKHNGGAGSNGHREELWSLAATLRARGYRIFLAGGLTPENVGEAVRRVDPYGIDVSAGVEKSPGVKDSLRLSRFVAEARR